MLRFDSLPRPLLVFLAALFAVATLGYSAAWVHFAGAQPQADLGVYFEYDPAGAALRVTDFVDEAGARTGLRKGDEILAVNGRRLDRIANYFDAVTRGEPGDVVTLQVARAGGEQPLTLEVVLKPHLSRLRPRTMMEDVALTLLSYYPALFAVVGVIVLLLRFQDRNAWLLALIFAGFISGAPALHLEGLLPAVLRRFLLTYKFLFSCLLPASFYYFFAVFPTQSPLDRRLPALKRILMMIGLPLGVWLGGWALFAGDSQPLLAFSGKLGAEWRYTIQGAILVPEAKSIALILAGIYAVAGMGLGLVSLVGNTLTAASPEARRKTRVILWGTVIGSAPIAALYLAAVSSRKPFYFYPSWVWMPAVFSSFLLPLSFAYAVVRHRVLGIQVMVKRTVRYFLVRGLFAAVIASLSLWLPWRLASASAFDDLSMAAAVPRAMLLGVAVGLVWAVGAGQAERFFTERIDRAFFRSTYDARHILQDLAEKTRTVSTREELAALLQQHVREALHPKALAVYFRALNGALVAQNSADGLPQSLSADSPVLNELALHARPWELPSVDEPTAPGFFATVSLPHLANLRALLEQGGTASEARQETEDVLWVLVRAGGECLVPLVGRDTRLVGLLVLGQRLSEEPYSDEDERLLGSVASQAAMALENFAMGESIARQHEAGQRARQEIEIAREVQNKLLPQKQLSLQTLEIVGRCIQARTVGGDFYDFLDLGSSRTAFLLADVAGKGIGAALLMASLQANLRSQYAIALDDMPRLLRSVNGLFFQSTYAERFATMFFAVYDDSSRRLIYANCGHSPPLLVRADGSTHWVASTCTVLGIFPDWQCELAELSLAPGDVLVVYSDGVSEAASDAGDFFGDERLAEAVRGHRHLPARELADAVVRIVQEFSGSEQEDDLTLLVARAL